MDVLSIEDTPYLFQLCFDKVGSFQKVSNQRDFCVNPPTGRFFKALNYSSGTVVLSITSNKSYCSFWLEEALLVVVVMKYPFQFQVHSLLVAILKNFINKEY